MSRLSILQHHTPQLKGNQRLVEDEDEDRNRSGSEGPVPEQAEQVVTLLLK